MTNNSHYFVAIPLEKEYQEWLVEWQEKLKQQETISYKSWTHKQDLHITLKFLGSADDSVITELAEKLQQLNEIGKFDIKIGNIGFFGKPQQPRVLWAGAEKNQLLDELQKRVERICVNLGFSMENRPYRPHITLAKKWEGGSTFKRDIKDEFAEEKIMPVNKFVIYKIHPSKNPKYEQVSEVNLK